MPDLIALVHEVGVQLRSVTEGIDTATINGKLTFHLFAALAEFERALVGYSIVRGRGIDQ